MKFDGTDFCLTSDFSFKTPITRLLPKKRPHIFQDFSEWLVTPVAPRIYLWFFNYRNKCYQKLLLEKKMKKWGHLSSVHFSILRMNQKWTILFCAVISKCLGHLMQVISLRFFRKWYALYDSGLRFYRYCGLNFEKRLTQQKFRKLFWLWSWYLLIRSS